MTKKIKIFATLLIVLPIIIVLHYRQTNQLKWSTDTFATFLKQSHDLHGKTIWIRAEWNLGDTMQFMRYAKKLHEFGATIILEPQKPLVKLLAQCPYIDAIMEKGIVAQTVDKVSYRCPCLGAILPEQKPNQSIDFIVSLARLPAIFDELPKNIWQETQIVPYLYANSDLVTYWKKQLNHDNNLKIGLCWFGDARHNPERFISLQKFTDLVRIDGISLYSLQKNEGVEQLEQFSEKEKIQTFGQNFDTTHGSFMDTAAIIKNLDLIITVDTSIAHLAGALGVKTWLLLPKEPEWRWQKPRNSAWSPNYPNTQVFTQPHPGDWQSVIQTITNLLQHQLQEKKECV